MKRCLLLSLLLALFFCGRKEMGHTMQPGEPSWELAAELSGIMPRLEPEKNRELIVTDEFVIGTHDVIYQIHNIYGKNAASLKNLDAERLTMEVERMAYDLALEKLLLSEVEKYSIDVEEKAVDSVLNLHYRRTGDRASFEKELNELGIDPAFVEKDIREGLLVDRLIERVLYKQVKPPGEAELKEMYDVSSHDLVTLRHLVIGVRDNSAAKISQKKKEINRILKKAREGKSFDSLVQQHSDDESSKAMGGLYKNLERGMMEATIESVAFSTPPGSVSDPFRTMDGFNLIKVESRETLDFREFKNREFESIFQKKKSEAYRDYIDSLKAESGFLFIGL